MNIEFVNHASFIAAHDNVRLICDPWTEGTAFNEGWSLISKSIFTPDDFRNITHIWFSHEHPDHFSPPNISRIDPEIRKKITVLYQETNDNKIIEWCRRKNFKDVIALKKNTYYKLNDDFEIMNSKHLWDDSWLFIKTKDKTILNVNDCVIKNEEDANAIAKSINSDVDILFTQFSYAGYHGNKDEPEERKKAADEKLDEIALQIKCFNPKVVVPFASFIWFSHKENYYMNEGINKIDRIYNYIRSINATPVVLYPGEVWNVNGEHDSQASVNKYMADYEKIFVAPVLKKSSRAISIDEIKASAKEMTNAVWKKYGKLYFKTKLRHLKPLIIYLTDLGTTVSFDFSNGLKVLNYNHFDVSMSTEVLNFCLKNAYGFNTTCINARLQKGSEEGLNKLVFYTEIANSINHEHAFQTPNYVKLAISKILRIAGIRKK